VNVGDIQLVPVPDGTAKLPPQYFLGPDFAPVDFSAHEALLGPDGMIDIPLGCFLVRTAGMTIVVDAGIGPFDSPIFSGGELPKRLEAERVGPDDVDLVVCTHLHVDHVGWLAPEGKPFFPNATVRFGAQDWGQFVTSMPDGDATKQAMLALQEAGRAEPIDSDGEIAPGVSTIFAPGHTHGHRCVVLSSGEARVLLLGDAVTCPVQIEEPEWGAMSDIDPALAKRSREALWRELEGTSDLAVAAHFPGLEFGRVLSGQGKRYFA
jgi:glyoxylase-like metal-dependent hydrolase (beta-lactamase superfamily II)